ncbi:MAG TPA: sulfite exporter TauE/SafE family protein [Gammaproteobacteria bacterium]|nr:sulfite exporter TauE/SafE family protein [Gammaproteobacteria bacterium]
MEYFFYFSLGAFAGLVAGLLGVGGGLIIVPVLTGVFVSQGLPETAIMHLAVGTSLATIVFTSLSSIRAHHRHGAVRWPVVAGLAPGIVGGAWGGAALAEALPGALLRGLFGLFEFYVAVQMLLNIKPRPSRGLPRGVGLMGAGSLIGALSTLVGIGGGTLTVPFLLWCNVPAREAIATSAACGLPLALAGSLGFIVAGWNAPDLPAASLGYVYLPALAGVVVASVFFAPLGAHLTHKLPAPHIKRAFAGLLLMLSAYMLLG